MTQILLTGGAGYIGSHCAWALMQKGYDVVIFDNLVHGHAEIVDVLRNNPCKGEAYFEKGDILSSDDLDKVFREYDIDAIMHFAAFIEVNESVKEPEKYRRNNVEGSRSLLEAAVRHDVRKMVFSSSAAIYGNPEYVPIDEDHPKNPINPYGETKWLVEQMLDEYSERYDVRSARLRYFNVAGASSKINIGEWHIPETHLIPNILRSVVNGGSFKLYGNCYETRDGTCIRDYVNIEDLADAHILAMEYLMNGGKTDFFNLGTEEGSTVLEIVKSCEKITGKKIGISLEGRREGDPTSLVADHSKATRILGWKPKRKLDDSIRTAYQWQCNRMKEYGQ